MRPDRHDEIEKVSVKKEIVNYPTVFLILQLFLGAEELKPKKNGKYLWYIVIQPNKGLTKLPLYAGLILVYLYIV